MRENIEIHSLICNKDVNLAINNFKSLQKYPEFQHTPIFLHDDGSLTDNDKNILETIDNVIFIEREWADIEINQFLKNYQNCFNYRLGESNINLWHKIKLFDYYYFSKTKKILGLDTDLLFLRKPENILNLIDKDIPFYFPDIQSSYSFNEPKNEVPVFEKVNTGLIYIPSEDYYSINDIEFALSNLIKNNINYFPAWIEQSAFAHMFHENGKYIQLSPEKYRIPYFQTVDIEISECLHFVSYPPVRETYQQYVDYIGFDEGITVFKKTFIKNFNNYEIPLTLEIFKVDDYFTLKYRWGVSDTEQKFLDHIFKIEVNNGEIEKKFQSEKNGFINFKTNQKYIQIEHTYEWYGEKSWEILDKVYLL